MAKQTSVSFNLSQKKVFDDLVVAGLFSGSFSDFVHIAFNDKVSSLRISNLNEGGLYEDSV